MAFASAVLGRLQQLVSYHISSSPSRELVEISLCRRTRQIEQQYRAIAHNFERVLTSPTALPSLDLKCTHTSDPWHNNPCIYRKYLPLPLPHIRCKICKSKIG